MKNMSDLRVESYDTNEVRAKKQSIAKRAVAAGGAIVLTLSLFSCASCVFVPPIISGGAGAWFHSCLEDDECTDDECKYTKDEHTEDK